MKKNLFLLFNKNKKLIAFLFLFLFIVSFCLIFSDSVKNYNNSKNQNVAFENKSLNVNYNEVEKELKKFDEKSIINLVNSSDKKLNIFLNNSSLKKDKDISKNIDNDFYSIFLNKQEKIFLFFKEKNYSIEQIQKFNQENFINKNFEQTKINEKIDFVISSIKNNSSNLLTNFELSSKNNFKMALHTRNIGWEKDLVWKLNIAKNSIDIGAGIASVTSAGLWAAAPWTFGATVLAAIMFTALAGILWAASVSIQTAIIYYDSNIPNSQKTNESIKNTLISSLFQVLGSAIQSFSVFLGFKQTVDSIINLVNQK